VTLARFACSPSSFHDAEACPLKFVRDGTSLLPTLPWHVHGTIVHELIASPPSDGDFEAAYDDRLTRLIDEARSAGSRDPWLVAFIRSDGAGRYSLDLPGFAVRRASGIALARRLAREAGRGGGGTSRGPTTHEVTVKVDSMTATIDAISEEDGRVVVTDFKTGSIRERGVDQSAIKPQYRKQLLIYAAMVSATSRRWPELIRLMGADGDVHEEGVERSEAEALLNRCIELRSEVQAALTEGRDEVLARGFGTSACVNCTRRHCCPRNRRALQRDGFVLHDAGDRRLFDLQGRVSSTGMGEERRWLTVILSCQPAATVRIMKIGRAKPSGLHRCLVDGTLIRVFGVRAVGRGSRVSQSPPSEMEATETTFIDEIAEP